ncbi:hypothetical protein [uncultured Ruminococcus sp.]|uniref:hypothetical protein n=1 Tax=uncultured Ruminococcus sp. TaxID=165186 RepID=UPI0025D2FFBC|nr:hypothetical protein [uncultured Ruminococcus sp.]
MIDDPVDKAKQIVAEEMATASEIHYLMYAGSQLMKENVLKSPNIYTLKLLSE